MKSFSTVLVEVETKKLIKEKFPNISYGEAIKLMINEYSKKRDYYDIN